MKRVVAQAGCSWSAETTRPPWTVGTESVTGEDLSQVYSLSKRMEAMWTHGRNTEESNSVYSESGAKINGVEWFGYRRTLLVEQAMYATTSVQPFVLYVSFDIRSLE